MKQHDKSEFVILKTNSHRGENGTAAFFGRNGSFLQETV